MKSLSRVRLLATPWTAAHQVPPSTGFSRQEYWSGVPSPGMVSILVSFSVQFSSVAQSCLTLCDPMNCSMAGLPVYHQLAEFTQAHVHRVNNAIQPSHPLSPLSPPAFNLSGSFPMSQPFTSGGQIIGVSASAQSFQ